LGYIDAVAKTYAPELVKDEPKPEPKTRKPRTTKPKPESKTEPEPEPKATEPNSKTLVELARETVKRGVERDAVKAVIAEYGVSKIDAIPLDKMAEFADKLKAL